MDPRDIIIGIDPGIDCRYHFIDGIVLVEEHMADGHIERVSLTEEDADKLSRMETVSPPEIRALMYQYTPY